MIRNVLLVIDRFGTGGAQTQLSLLCAELLRSGVAVTVLTYHPSDYFLQGDKLAGARLVSHFKQTRSGRDVVGALVEEIRRGDFQAVISFLVGSCAYAELACRLASYQGVLIVGERNTFLGGRPTIKQWLQRLGHHFADYVVANSEAQCSALAACMPWLRPRIRFIPNAVDTAKYRPCQRSDSPGETKRLLVVARVVPEKNALGLARALARLHDMGHLQVEVDWVGKVHNEAYFQECQQAIEEFGLIAHWHWHAETADLLPHYHGATAFVLPSFHEGMPNVVCEALACGLPCAISDLPESSWLIDGGSNGSLFDPRDTESMANAIGNLMSLDESHLRRLRENAVTFANSRLSVQRMTSEYLGLVERGIGR